MVTPTVILGNDNSRILHALWWKTIPEPIAEKVRDLRVPQTLLPAPSMMISCPGNVLRWRSHLSDIFQLVGKLWQNFMQK